MWLLLSAFCVVESFLLTYLVCKTADCMYISHKLSIKRVHHTNRNEETPHSDIIPIGNLWGHVHNDVRIGFGGGRYP